MRVTIPPVRFVFVGMENNSDEIWFEYKLSDPNHIVPSPQPITMHAVQIENIIRVSNDMEPIITRLHNWFNPLNKQIIIEQSLPIGRFLQAAYN